MIIRVFGRYSKRCLKSSVVRVSKDGNMEDLVGSLLDGTSPMRDVKSHIDVPIENSKAGRAYILLVPYIIYLHSLCNIGNSMTFTLTTVYFQGIIKLNFSMILPA